MCINKSTQYVLICNPGLFNINELEMTSFYTIVMEAAYCVIKTFIQVWLCQVTSRKNQP
jgi:hypothetical protein